MGAVGAGTNQTDMLADFVERTDVDVVMGAGQFTPLDHTALKRLLPAATDRGAFVGAAVDDSGVMSSAVRR